MEAEQLAALYDLGLYQSIEILAPLSVNQAEVMSVNVLMQFAKSLFQIGEYRRALKYFNIAAEKEKSEPKLNEIKQCSADCLMKLKEDKFALKILREIHENSGPSALSTKSKLVLAKLVAQTDGKRKAVPFYVEVLRDCPYAIESVFAAIDGGISPLELENLLKGKLGEMKWVNLLLRAYYSYSKNEYQKAIEKFNELAQSLPQNLQVLKYLALCHYSAGNYTAAVDYFQKIRQIDTTFVDSMDVFGFILKSFGKITELNILSHDLLQASPYRAETWTTIAIYYDAKGKKDVALNHLEKAKDADPFHYMTYYHQGLCYCYLKQVEQAIRSLNTSKNIHKSLPTYKALTMIHLSISSIEQAKTVARDAQKIFPNNPSANCLPALVMAHSNESSDRNKAVELFQEILKQDPDCLDAVTGLALTYKLTERYNEATQLLKASIDKFSRDSLYTALGDVLFTMEKYDEALINYENALKLNQSSEAAQSGILNIQKIMQGGTEPTEDTDFEDNA
uniref:Anaphase-promoting complex subunit 7 n=1 Tax=Arcella intermedia TaxID=1963864 RepID=A0A6B2L271_9EUKA|eukprot:TRINITY_DN18740_c0_g1_i1.p1 TRINITY_DN18740_c0_g1~~TRINITY_DN18740_c0_g1_i1.p1  ORF type:complete len:520 (-),score=147.37 TRINITY_DN18740_c0_g1_i1:49-1572(-)